MDKDIKKKHDLRTTKGKADAEREQGTRNTEKGIDKLFHRLWFFLKLTIIIFIVALIGSMIDENFLQNVEGLIGLVVAVVILVWILLKDELSMFFK